MRWRADVAVEDVAVEDVAVEDAEVEDEAWAVGEAWAEAGEACEAARRRR